MDFQFPDSAERFRDEVRQFIASRPMADYSIDAMDGGYGSGPVSHEFMRAMGERGWIALTWPTEAGGGNRPMVEMLVMLDELARASAPMGPLVGSDQWGWSLIRHANDRLKDELLEGIAAGTKSCWQGFSEPDAGSDLLALTTRAELDGDEWVINGRKIWSSEAGAYTHGQVLARTQPLTDGASRTSGLTMFVVPNDAAGLTLRPIVSLTGEVYHYEAFLDDVRVPEWAAMSPPGEGFRELLRGLDRDRFWGRFHKAPSLIERLERLATFARETERDGRPIIEEPGIAHRLVELQAETEATRLLFYKFGWQLDHEIPTPYESALYKTLADELGQRVANLAVDIIGPATLLGGEDDTADEMRQLYLTSVGQTIAGGTSEVLRTTVATRGLGLPKG